MTRKRILVPVDFSAQSDLALEYAERMAEKLSAMISCIYVIEEQGFIADKMASGESKHRLRREAENRLSEKVNSILNKEKKIPFEIIITSGKVHEKVLEKAADLDAHIIVMGRSNTAHKNATKTGSNTKKVISSTRLPVLTVTDQRISKPGHLILPLDLDEPFSLQVHWAIGMAYILDASVDIIAVVEKERTGHRPVYLSKLRETACLVTEKGLKCDTFLLEKQTTIPREILSFADERKFGTLLMMTHQERKTGGSALGSTASEMLARTNLPVIFIHPNHTPRLFPEDDHIYNQHV